MSDVIVSVGSNVQSLLKVNAIASNCTGTAWLCHTTRTSDNAAALGRVLKTLGVKAQLVSLETVETGNVKPDEKAFPAPLDPFHAINSLKAIKLSDDSFNLIDETTISSFVVRAYPHLRTIQIENHSIWVEKDKDASLHQQALSLSPLQALNFAAPLLSKGERGGGKFRYIPKPKKAALEALTNAGLVAAFDDFETPRLTGSDGWFITPEGVIGTFAFLNPKKPMQEAAQAWEACQALSNSSILILIGEEAEACAQSLSRKVRDYSIFAIANIFDEKEVKCVVDEVLASSRQGLSIRDD